MAMAGWRWSSLEGREEEVFFFFFSFFFFCLFVYMGFFSRSDKRFCFFIKIFFLVARSDRSSGRGEAGGSE